MKDNVPKFRIDKKSSSPRVFVLCSSCDKDIREMKPHESIQVTRAYYCDDCDPGAIVLNVRKETVKESKQ